MLATILASVLISTQIGNVDSIHLAPLFVFDSANQRRPPVISGHNGRNRRLVVDATSSIDDIVGSRFPLFLDTINVT